VVCELDPANDVDVVDGLVVVVEFERGIEVEELIRLFADDESGDVVTAALLWDEPDDALGVCEDEQLASTADAITISAPTNVARPRRLLATMTSLSPDMGWDDAPRNTRCYRELLLLRCRSSGGGVDGRRDE
jgi:hypothetical protein